MTHSLVTVYIPTAKLSDPDVRDAVNTLRWIARGMTSQTAEGSWLSDSDNQVIVEPVTLLSFITAHYGDNVTSFLAVVDRLVEILKATGEESVLVTSANTVASFK